MAEFPVQTECGSGWEMEQRDGNSSINSERGRGGAITEVAAGFSGVYLYLFILWLSLTLFIFCFGRFGVLILR